MQTLAETISIIEKRIEHVKRRFINAEEIQIRINASDILALTEKKCPENLQALRAACETNPDLIAPLCVPLAEKLLEDFKTPVKKEKVEAADE